MNPKNVAPLLKELGGKISRTTSTWVSCSCIFAPWRHEGGRDKHPSSGMSIKKGKEPEYFCFTCKSRGTAENIYAEIKYLNQKSPRIDLDKRKIIDLLMEEYSRLRDIKVPDYEEEINKPVNSYEPFSDRWYSRYKPASNHPYLKERGVNKHDAKDLEVRYDPTHRRILFPVRDWEGRLMGVHGRAVDKGVEPRYYAYPRNGNPEGVRNPDIWMGEHHSNLDEPVILTEGQFDYAKVFYWYENVLAGLTTQLTEAKLRRIEDASKIITIFDYGLGGDNGRELISKKFKHCPVKHLYVPEEYGDLGNMPDYLVKELLSEVD